MVYAVYPRLMFNLFSLFVLCAAGLTPAIADDDTAAQEFQSKAQSLGESISSDNSGISDRCQRLFQNVQDLKGKPQQRFNARQLYDRECRDPMSSPDYQFPGNEPGYAPGLVY